MSYNEFIKTYESAIKTLTPEEKQALIEKVKAGDAAAKEQFVLQNLKLVTKVALDKTKNNGYSIGSLEIEDLIQEGIFGLTKAVDRFDWNSGTNFASYAVPWIERAMQQAIQREACAIKLPEHVIRAIVIINKTKEELRNKLEREPSEEEVIQILRTRIKEDKIKQTLKILDMTNIVELNATINYMYDGDIEIGDRLEDEADTPEQVSEKDDQLNALHAAIAQLPEIEQYVIKMRYGFAPFTETTLEQTGKDLCKYGVTQKELTKERIRQLQCKAEMTLRQILSK